jgi:predicted O-methyltransferase YrrM
LLSESAVHPHSPEERASHFRSWSGGTTEVEYRNLVVALADCLKPVRALETGIFHPVGVPALAAVCERLDLVDTDQRWCVAATALGLTNVHVHQDSGQHWIEHGFHGKPFDFAFLDSALDRRCGELEALLEKQRLAPGAVVAIHDTSRVRVMGGGRCPESLQFWDAFERLRKTWRLEVVELPLSRGMLLVQRAR